MDEPCHISSLAPTQRDPQRVSIKVGRKYVATVSVKHVAELGLHVGQMWTPALAARVEEAALFDKAMKRAMNRLGRRAMSRRDLDRKLKDLEFDESVRQQVLDRLEELKYLDDEAFGRSLIRETILRKPAGPRLLRQKLMQKGLDRQIIDQLLAEMADDGDDQTQAATELARKKLRSMARLDTLTRKRRLYGLLARRGFTPDVIDTALRQLADDL